MKDTNSCKKNTCESKDTGYYNSIHCDVKNCVYHDADCRCTASCINVGPSFAQTSSDTVCATFKEKK